MNVASFMVRCKRTSEIKYDSTKMNNFTDLFQVWKIAGQLSRLFQKFKTLRTLSESIDEGFPIVVVILLVA